MTVRVEVGRRTHRRRRLEEIQARAAGANLAELRQMVAEMAAILKELELTDQAGTNRPV